MSSHVELPSNPAERKKLQMLIKDCVVAKQKAESIKDGMNETIDAAVKEFNIPKKFINRLVTTAFKRNFEQQQVEYESFEHMYESLMNENHDYDAVNNG